MNLKAGTVLQNGQYVINATLGRGAFGITYRAIETYLNLPVTIKTLNASLRYHADFEQYNQQFRAAAEGLRECQHPHIVRVFDCFQENGLIYIVMEYIPGRTLAEQIKSGQILTEGQALSYIRQIGAALSLLHQKGFLHRDIKPQNVIRRKGTHCVVLTDFGIACEFTPRMARTYASLLSAGYAAIEQYIPESACTAATDVYALAATLYYLLTGSPPVAAPLRDRFPLKEWRQFQPTLSSTIESAIRQGLEIEAQRRPQTVEAWLALLDKGDRAISTATIDSLTTVELSNPLMVAKSLKSGETKETLLLPTAQHESAQVQRILSDRSPQKLLPPNCDDFNPTAGIQRLLSDRSPQKLLPPAADSSISQSPDELESAKVQEIAIDERSQPKLLPPSADLKGADSRQQVQSKKAKKTRSRQSAKSSLPSSDRPDNPSAEKSETWPADESLLLANADSSRVRSEQCDNKATEAFDSDLGEKRNEEKQLSEDLSKKLSEKDSTHPLLGSPPSSKQWLALTFALTAAIASLAGASFGFALRFSKIGQPGSTIFHTEQSFPPLKNWPGADPAQWSSDDPSQDTPSAESSPNSAQPPLADWLDVPQQETGSNQLAPESDDLNAQPEAPDSEATFESETAPNPSQAAPNSDSLPEPIAEEAEGAPPQAQWEGTPHSEWTTKKSQEWVRSRALSDTESDIPLSPTSPEILAPDSPAINPDTRFEPGSGIIRNIQL